MSESDTLTITIIEEGHGLKDVSCKHGSRFIWWKGQSGKGKWQQVIMAPDCDCNEPPSPYFQPSSQSETE